MYIILYASVIKKYQGKDIKRKNLQCLQLFAANERRWTGPAARTASPTNSILRVPAGLTPACKTRGFRRFAIHPPQRQASLSNPNFLQSFACRFGRHPFANVRTASDSHETVRRGQKQTL